MDMRNRENRNRNNGRSNKNKKKNSLKKRWAIAALLLLFALCMMAGGEQATADELQKGIADKILRFHVIANSDSEEDQALKLEVKEAVVRYMQGIFSDVSNLEESRETARAHQSEIQQIAEEVVRKNGFRYPVRVFLDRRYFPIKAYDNYTFPAGEYEALCVEIGESRGKNWWCVMYPSLCFVDAVHAVVPEESREELEEILTDEEYEAIAQGKTKVKFTFKFLEWFR